MLLDRPLHPMEGCSFRAACHKGQPLTYESQQVSTDSGTRLVAYRWPAQGDTIACLVIVHGMAEHARRYTRLAEHLASAGIEVHAFDLRGHGATTRSIDHGDLGERCSWQTLIDDVQRVRQRAAGHADGAPIFLFGHSLGSFIATAVLEQFGDMYTGAILSGTDRPSPTQCRAAALLARIECARMGANGVSDALQRLTVGAYDRRLARYYGPVRGNAWLSGDDAAVDAYNADPDCGFALRVGAWHTLLNGIARTSSAHRLRRLPMTLPLLILAGRDDPMGKFGRGPQRVARALDCDGQRDLELRLYDGQRHELLHDIHADTVIADIRRWLEARALKAAHTAAPFPRHKE